jgi:hypothetical protein
MTILETKDANRGGKSGLGRRAGQGRRAKMRLYPMGTTHTFVGLGVASTNSTKPVKALEPVTKA